MVFGEVAPILVDTITTYYGTKVKLIQVYCPDYRLGMTIGITIQLRDVIIHCSTKLGIPYTIRFAMIDVVLLGKFQLIRSEVHTILLNL
jgi:hypothetical protein